MSVPLKGKKPTPVLMQLNLRIQIPLVGLAKKVELTELSEKRVTRKVREILKQPFNNKRIIKVACKALQKKGIWIGFGTLKGNIFTWLVSNSDSANI
jgi:hypothetical protein